MAGTRWGTPKDLTALLRDAVRLGVIITRTGSGHLRCTYQGRFVIVSNSPRAGGRTDRVRRDLRRIGVPLS